MKLFFSSILLLFIFRVSAIAQVDVKAGFLKKEITLGEPVEIYVKCTHPAALGIIYPDSTGNFQPFQYIDRSYYPTITENGISRDCTVYQLRLFQLNPNPAIAIPVYAFFEKDTLKFYSEPVSLRLKELISSVDDFAELKVDNSLVEMPQKINYPLILLITAILLIAFSIGFRYLGKPIVIRYKIFKTVQNHRNFILQFDKLDRNYQLKREVLVLENLLSSWKEYLTDLEDKPISSYTSTEILQYFNKEELQASLRNIDHAIFGGIKSKEVLADIKNLKKFSNSRYIHRKNEIRKG